MGDENQEKVDWRKLTHRQFLDGIIGAARRKVESGQRHLEEQMKKKVPDDMPEALKHVLEQLEKSGMAKVIQMAVGEAMTPDNLVDQDGHSLSESIRDLEHFEYFKKCMDAYEAGQTQDASDAVLALLKEDVT